MRILMKVHQKGNFGVLMVVSQFEVLVTRHARESGHPEVSPLGFPPARE